MRKDMPQLVEAMDRLGTESAFEVLARANKLAQGGMDVINLGIGQPDFKTPEHIVEAAIKAMRDGHHGYTPANGILEVREAVAADILKYKERRTVNPDHVVLMPGGKPTMFFACLMFGATGHRDHLSEPGVPDLRIGHQIFGRQAGAHAAV
jgi:aspartate aminotransferase